LPIVETTFYIALQVRDQGKVGPASSQDQESLNARIRLKVGNADDPVEWSRTEINRSHQVALLINNINHKLRLVALDGELFGCWNVGNCFRASDCGNVNLSCLVSDAIEENYLLCSTDAGNDKVPV